MGVTSDELKTIAATSAIAAAGGALATALVTYAVDRWILKEEESKGPTFVVVPVVDRDVPPQLPPMQPPVQPPVTPPSEPEPQVVGFGALSAQQISAIQQLAPWRYWQEFYQCWDEEDPAYQEHCRQLTQMYNNLGDKDQKELDSIVSSVPNVSKKEYVTHILLATGAGVALGVLLTSTLMS